MKKLLASLLLVAAFSVAGLAGDTPGPPAPSPDPPTNTQSIATQIVVATILAIVR